MSVDNIMVLSKYEGISQKLEYLANTITDKDLVGKTQCYIKCDSLNGAKSITVGTIGGDHVWTKFRPLDVESGNVLESIISVNLYDLFNVLDNCRDDAVTMYIDNDSNELVIGAYYNDVSDYDELEVRLAINVLQESDLPKATESPIVATFELTQVISYTIPSYAQQLGATKLAIDVTPEGISLGFIGENYAFTSTPKMVDTTPMPILVGAAKVVCVDIPLHMFALMTSTGQISNVRFNITFDGTLICNTESVGFSVRNCVTRDTPIADSMTECKSDGFIMSVETAAIVFETLGKLNKPNTNQVIHVEKYAERVAEFTTSMDNRMVAKVKGDCAPLMESSFDTSLTMLRFIFSKAGCDAVRIKYNENGECSCRYENGWIKALVTFNKNFV